MSEGRLPAEDPAAANSKHWRKYHHLPVNKLMSGMMPAAVKMTRPLPILFFFEFFLRVQLSLVCNCIYMFDIYNSNLAKHPVCADTDLNAKFCVLQMTAKMCFRTLSLF